MMDYGAFLAGKAQSISDGGFIPDDMPDFLFPFQAALVEWATRKGRSAVFADCGLGKTPIQLVWADMVSRRSDKPVLILTPLAVAQQTVHEGEKFGIESARSSNGSIKSRIVVTNYERLHYFTPSDFSGVVCDESSILKSFDGATRAAITEFMRKVEYRLLCTATAAPNDYIELGSSSEALGHLGYMDMLARFFKNDQNTSDTARKWANQGAPKWRFRGHAETPFWRWVCSWARALRRPSDLGFDDTGFELPELIEQQHMVDSITPRNGMLFNLPAVGLFEQRQERRATIRERCERAASLVNGTGQPCVSWCHLNDEGDLLEELIDGAVQISGKDSDDSKESKLIDFSRGNIRSLITKPVIGAWGLNWQHCAHMTFFPSHSFEQYYQSVRRCWRFGQTRPVSVDIITTEGEADVLKNMQRKAAAAELMFERLVGHMNEAQHIDRMVDYKTTVEVPSWL